MSENEQNIKKAIEESFPIVEVNRIAEPERNSFKPIYQMHKWWARRASSVFRSILLGAMKPAGTDIMKEFYKDHSNDPDTNGVTVLDPFMGGGTTIVEALRLGAKAIGVDLNPVAWFIVKTEVEPVDIDELNDAFERLEKRKTLSGNPLKEELLSYYKTDCTCCGHKADSIYTFWVKSAICTNPNCKEQVPLFKNYVIAQKSPSIRYFKDCECTTCATKFDWELDAATLMPFSELTITGRKSGGESRMHAKWTYAPESGAPNCPKCQVLNKPEVATKKQRKKVPLHVLLCPECYEVWQYRGEIPDEVDCPTCKYSYDPSKGNIPGIGKFTCQACGTTDRVIHSIRRMKEEELFPTRPYAIEAYCKVCTGKKQDDVEQFHLYDNNKKTDKVAIEGHDCELKKNNGKYFKKFDSKDHALWQNVETKWNELKEQLPYPKSKVPIGQETRRLLEYHYQYWFQMFNPRQLLALSSLLKAIDEEEDQILKEMLLSGFYNSLESNNMFTRYRFNAFKSEGVFARHDFQIKTSFVVGNVWGMKYGKNSFKKCKSKVIDGKLFTINPFDLIQPGATKRYNDPIQNPGDLFIKNSEHLSELEYKSIDYVITDPPYGGNVNYSELADFFYVWIRLILAKSYPVFTPEITDKEDEVIENPTRGKTASDFEKGLTNVYRECNRVLKDDGLMVFTFHHKDGDMWEALLESILNAGFYLEAVYPIHGESSSSLHLMGKSNISFDLIHVCKKLLVQPSKNKSWAGVRREIRRLARAEIADIEKGRYGKGLNPEDIQIVLIGKCLEIYSQNYGFIVDYEGKPIPLHQALLDISEMVSSLMTKESPFPTELEDTIDTQSKIYIRFLAGNKEIQSDSVYKYTRGTLEVEDLMKAGLVVRGRAKRGRTFEIKGYDERYSDLLKLLAPDKLPIDDGQETLFEEEEIRPAKDTPYFVDKIHFLIGLVANGENVFDWIQKWDGYMPQIKAAVRYMIENDSRDKDLLIKLQSLISEDLFVNQNSE